MAMGDDEASVRGALQRLLRLEGCRTVVCAAAEDLWHAGAVDFVYTLFPEEALRRAMRSSRKAGQGLRAEQAPSRSRGKLARVALRFTLHARLWGPAWTLAATGP
jgi:hypothetical protein